MAMEKFINEFTSTFTLSQLDRKPWRYQYLINVCTVVIVNLRNKLDWSKLKNLIESWEYVICELYFCDGCGTRHRQPNAEASYSLFADGCIENSIFTCRNRTTSVEWNGISDDNDKFNLAQTKLLLQANSTSEDATKCNVLAEKTRGRISCHCNIHCVVDRSTQIHPACFTLTFKFTKLTGNRPHHVSNNFSFAK